MRLRLQPEQQTKLPISIRRLEEAKAGAMNGIFTGPEIEELLESIQQSKPSKPILSNNAQNGSKEIESWF